MTTAADNTVLILIPCFNDWDAVGLLLPRIDAALAGAGWRASVLVVDDASSEPVPAQWPGAILHSIESVQVLHLRCNLGHQRAIALGLYYAHEFTNVAAVLVMDGDGEDRAEDVPVLLRRFVEAGRTFAAFAARTRRMESLAFQFFYHVYRIVHLVLTGVEVRVGNFSVLPRAALTRLMAVSDLWNNYSAAVFRARLPRILVPLARGRRLAGTSRMNFVSLLTHGLSAISVFSEQMSARLLAAAAVLGTGTFALAGWAGVSWLLGALVPPLVRSILLAALCLTIPSVAAAVLFAFAIISRRAGSNFVLLRDARYFILDTMVAQANTDLGRLSKSLGESTRSDSAPARIEVRR